MGHHGRWHADSTRGTIVKELKDHPIVSGVKDIWGPSDVYRTYKEGTGLPEDCTALADDDGDGWGACYDCECVGDADLHVDCATVSGATCEVEACNDGVDNDLNGAIDCDDAECSDQPCCTAQPGTNTCP